MTIKLSLLIITSLFCLNSFSQEDPLDKIKKPKSEKAKDEQKLSGKGKAAFEKAKTDLKNVSGAKFELAANEIMNQDAKELGGIPENQKPDENLSRKQNEENKKKKNEINLKLKTDAKDPNINLDFSVSPTLSPGAAWAAPTFWYPAYYTSVKNQGGCGSCYAFAACATYEHTYKKFWGKNLDLSEQDVVSCGVSCTSGSDIFSCGGGWADMVFDFIKCKGIAIESIYPYTASNGPCIAKPKSKWAYTWGRLYSGSGFPTRDLVKTYISYFGSVLSLMKAHIYTFYAYGYGVYNGYPSNSSNSIDQAVTIVGWNDYLNAWIIKMSWGTSWGGYGGYAYVGYDQCNLAKYVWWVYPKY